MGLYNFVGRRFYGSGTSRFLEVLMLFLFDFGSRSCRRGVLYSFSRKESFSLLFVRKVEVGI